MGIPQKTETAEYDRIAREVFLPIFPMIARKALSIYGSTDGLCLDLGCGGGMFGYFVMLLSEISVHFVDLQQDAIDLCRKRGQDWGLMERGAYTVSDVHCLPMPDRSFSLIVSRGSIPFWGEGEELVQAFREIDRVLAPGGTAMIGGSLGTPSMQAAITRRMKEMNPNWNPPGNSCGGCTSGYEEKSRLLHRAGIPHQVDVGDEGHWIILKK